MNTEEFEKNIEIIEKQQISKPLIAILRFLYKKVTETNKSTKK